jgi:hypothetical protein
MASAVLSELADSNGTIKAKIDEAVVRERLSSSIYGSPSSAFRELYANELRACREARKRGLNPVIEITLNKKERTLTIQGVDSTGMTKEKFTGVLAVIGETDGVGSGTEAETGTGTGTEMMGLGYMAFRVLSDTILFEVRSLESGETFAYLGNGDVYQSVPLSRPLEKTGTRVTVTLRNGVDIDNGLPGEIRRICRYSDIDTFLTKIDEDGKNDDGPAQINTPRLADDSGWQSAFVEIYDEDIEFVAYGLDVREKEKEGRAVETLLLRLPIQAPLIESAFPFDLAILNIKNETKYPPTVDRERLTEQAQKDIIAALKQKLSEKLPGALDLRTLDDLRKSDYRLLYADKLYTRLEDLYRPSAETLEISELAGAEVSSISLDENGELVEDQHSLFVDLLDSRNIFYSETLNREMLYVLAQQYRDAVLFNLYDPKSGKKRFIDLFKKYGVRFDAAEECKRIKAGLPEGWQKGMPRRPPADTGLPNEILIHRSGVSSFLIHGFYFKRLVRCSTKYPTANGLDGGRFIFIERISDYLPILNQVDSTYRLTKLESRSWATARPDIVTLEKFIETLRKKEVETSDGRLTFEDIQRNGKRPAILVYDDQRLASVYRPEGDAVFIPADPETAFELAVWCVYHKMGYEIRHVVPEREFREATGVDRFHYFNRRHNGVESYETDAMTVANCAFHVALAVKDKALVGLYLKAVEGEDDAGKAIRERNFVLELWERRTRAEAEAGGGEIKEG